MLGPRNKLSGVAEFVEFGICCRELGGLKVASFRACVCCFCPVYPSTFYDYSVMYFVFFCHMTTIEQAINLFCSAKRSGKRVAQAFIRDIYYVKG